MLNNSTGSGSYPKYYYESSPITAAAAGSNTDKAAAKIISRNEDTFVDKIYKFFDKFLHFWPSSSSSSINEVDKKSEKNSKNEIEERIDEQEDGESSGLGKVFK